MSRIVCSLPNASNEINGVRFAKREAGMVSIEELPDDVVARFLSIPGYAVFKGPTDPGDEPPGSDDSQEGGEGGDSIDASSEGSDETPPGGEGVDSVDPGATGEGSSEPAAPAPEEEPKKPTSKKGGASK